MPSGSLVLFYEIVCANKGSKYKKPLKHVCSLFCNSSSLFFPSSLDPMLICLMQSEGKRERKRCAFFPTCVIPSGTARAVSPDTGVVSGHRLLEPRGCLPLKVWFIPLFVLTQRGCLPLGLMRLVWFVCSSFWSEYERPIRRDHKHLFVKPKN